MNTLSKDDIRFLVSKSMFPNITGKYRVLLLCNKHPKISNLEGFGNDIRAAKIDALGKVRTKVRKSKLDLIIPRDIHLL
jgi:hypothetical protein